MTPNETPEGEGTHDNDYDAALERLTARAGHLATDRVESRIPDLVDLLSAHGIHSIVLKGPATRQRLYGDDEQRPTADVDLLVNAAEFRHATRLLHDQGYHRVDRHGHSDALRCDDAEIDLHLTLPHLTVGPARVFAVLGAHVTSLHVAGRSVPVLDAPAHAVHLAIHAAVNRFDPASRTLDEWRRGAASLTDDESATAATIAHDLGVDGIWQIAHRVLQGNESTNELLQELPALEVEPRMRSLRRIARAGVPLIVRRRDAHRMISLQLGDEAVNKWRADRDRAPLAPGSWAIRFAKGHRLVAVTLQGSARIGRSSFRSRA